MERRAKSGAAPAVTAERDAIEKWYDFSTLDLLKDSPINCLIVSWSGPSSQETLARQHEILKAYTAAAHDRGLSVLGLVYGGADLPRAAKEAADAALDGLVLEREVAGTVVPAAGAPPIVIRIVDEGTALRTTGATVTAVEGVSASARRLAEMGIRSGPSTQPWIEFNIWLVRAIRQINPAPTWLDYRIENASASDYMRAIADASIGGGHWIIALDDKLRTGLWRKENVALQTWRLISSTLRFPGEGVDWTTYAPYGNVALLYDRAAAHPDADEYLKLVARRQVPYRLLDRARLNADTLARFRAVVATQPAPPTDSERKLLRDFAEKGGIVIAGPSWANPPPDRYTETALGKGRVVVYKDPDPESVARDLRDLLSDEELGVTSFNVLSVIISVDAADSGRRILVQLLNYSNSPAEAITLRVQGDFHSAHLHAPGEPVSDLPCKRSEGQVEVSISKLSLWGAVLLE